MKHCLFAAVIAVSAANIILRAEQQSVVERDLTSWGGWALLASTCPAGTAACGDSSAGSCCPTSYTCNTKGSMPICCPTATDCSANVEALNACADESWDLYSFGGFFCCASDEIGTDSSAGRQCIANNLPIPTSISLTTVSQVTGTRNVGAATGTGVAPTSSSRTAGTSSGAGSGSTSATGSNSNSGTESVQGTQTTLSVGSTPSAKSDEPSSSSTSSKVSSAATIAIGVLAAVVALLVAFIIWRFTKRRNTTQQQTYTTLSPSLQTSETAGGAHATAQPYNSSPVVYKHPDARTQELSGNSVRGPIYETGPGEHIELDGTNHR